jgi:hypothetical protein
MSKKKFLISFFVLTILANKALAQSNSVGVGVNMSHIEKLDEKQSLTGVNVRLSHLDNGEYDDSDEWYPQLNSRLNGNAGIQIDMETGRPYFDMELTGSVGSIFGAYGNYVNKIDEHSIAGGVGFLIGLVAQSDAQFMFHGGIFGQKVFRNSALENGATEFDLNYTTYTQKPGVIDAAPNSNGDNRIQRVLTPNEILNNIDHFEVTNSTVKVSNKNLNNSADGDPGVFVALAGEKIPVGKGKLGISLDYKWTWDYTKNGGNKVAGSVTEGTKVINNAIISRVFIENSVFTQNDEVTTELTTRTLNGNISYELPKRNLRIYFNASLKNNKLAFSQLEQVVKKINQSRLTYELGVAKKF